MAEWSLTAALDRVLSALSNSVDQMELGRKRRKKRAKHMTANQYFAQWLTLPDAATYNKWLGIIHDVRESERIRTPEIEELKLSIQKDFMYKHGYAPDFSHHKDLKRAVLIYV
jgi:hypothetical protein